MKETKEAERCSGVLEKLFIGPSTRTHVKLEVGCQSSVHFNK